MENLIFKYKTNDILRKIGEFRIINEGFIT